MRILLAGASGFIGKALVEFLEQRGHEIIHLVREAAKANVEKNRFLWNPETEEIDPRALERIDAVINLAGENIFSLKWNPKGKKKILESRLQATRTLVSAFRIKPPKVWIQASAIGFYGDSKDTRTEGSPRGQGFLAKVCHDWEQALQPELDARTVILRFGLVLGKEGGVLKKLVPLFRLGLGGRLGSGQQSMSWIALDDLLSLFQFVLTHEVHGVINAVSPEIVTNRAFTAILAKVLKRPAFFVLPAFVLRLLFGKEKANELFLFSLPIKSLKLQDLGYQFHYPHLEDALQNSV